MAIDPNRVRDYKVAELSKECGESEYFVRTWIDNGDFGEEGDAWRWSGGRDEDGKGVGIRLVRAWAVREFLRKRRSERGGDIIPN